ncbi:MAG: hypothetical protein HY876_06230 [Coriobacteriales bacterium]|nr:hypothetical protein [Coriobacteriales bacterium]
MHNELEQMRVVIATPVYRIEGTAHVVAGSRLTDALNSRTKDFLAVTEAKVFDLATGVLVYEPPYLAVNRDAIHVIFPTRPS